MCGRTVRCFAHAQMCTHMRYELVRAGQHTILNEVSK